MSNEEPSVDLTVSGKDLGPFCPWYVDDFLGGTTLYNATMIGAYHLLLLHQWAYGYVPRDLTACQTIARCDQATVERILEPPAPEKPKFVLHSCGGLVNTKMAQIRNERLDHIREQRRKATLSVEARRAAALTTVQAVAKTAVKAVAPIPVATPPSASASAISDKDPHTPGAGVASGFDQFWISYPRKVGKVAAEREWKKAKEKPSIEHIIAKINTLKLSDQWAKDGGRFIPHPATWIRRGGWDDEAVSAESGVASTDDEWSRAYRDIAESIWRAQADNYEGGLKRAMQKARDTYGDIPKKNGVDVVNAAIGMAMNNQRPKDWAMQ